jgi:GxxExxY protein
VLYHQGLTERIIGLAIEVHRHSGSGLLESFYAVALCRALECAGGRVRREVGISAIYKGEPLPLGFRADILVDETAHASHTEIRTLPKSRQFRHCCQPMTCNCRLI